MNFLLWLSKQLDALAKNKSQIALGVLGIAALAAVVFFGPMLFDDSSRLGQMRAPSNANVVITKPLGPPAEAQQAPDQPQAPVAQPAPDRAPESEPVKPIVVAAPPAPAPAPPAPAPAAPATASAATYQVQLGAFQEEARANQLAKRVARAGFDATVISVDLPDRGRFYRVRLKPELSHEEAKQLLAKLHKKMPKQKPIVVRSGS
ncbi:MAG: SPOR domain-containing protein [Burkholderiales bacterium]